jgi:hypothetical protein
VVLALGWFAIVVWATYRLHVLTRIRQQFPAGRAGQVQAFCVAGLLWGVAVNIAWLPVIAAFAA